MIRMFRSNPMVSINTSGDAYGIRRAAVALSLMTMVTSCATVQVSQTPSMSAEPVPTTISAAHWRFDSNSPRQTADRDGYRPAVKLAVLLPQSGALATAAAPVRDGLLAGYYGESRQRPELVFYDTAGTPSGAVAAYTRAIAEGADQIIGPLGRDEVNAVFATAQTQVPMIALNRATTPPPLNSASFSLGWEDEGIAAAGYVLSRNARRILILSNGDERARRSAAAFRQTLEAQGGTIVDTIAIVGDKPADSTAVLQASALKVGSIDAVWLLLKTVQVRAVIPQLLTAGLGGKMRLATSQLAYGSTKSEQNRLLDGVAFPTTRWSARGVSGLPSTTSVATQLPTARGPAARLFAFGYDAWRLSVYLEHLATSKDASLQGATGVLRIEPNGNLLYQPAWSTYSGGVVVPLTGG